MLKYKLNGKIGIILGLDDKGRPRSDSETYVNKKIEVF